MLKRGSPLRQVLFAVGAGVGVFVITQFVLPGGSGPARGTPAAILFSGLVVGALNGLIALGLVLIYRTSRVVNFAQAALGATGAIFAYDLVVVYHLPYGLALAAAVIISGAIGWLAELFLRRFFNSPRLVVTIVTIGIGAFLATYAVGFANSLPIWGDSRDLIESIGGATVRPLPSIHFQIGKVPLPFYFSSILTLIVLVVAVLAVGAFLRFTKLGVAVRASSENSERAELLGINVRSLSSVVWVIAGALAGISLTLQGTVQGFALNAGGAPAVLIAALAAAVIARMRSMPIAVYAAILIAIMESAIEWSFRDQASFVQAGLFLVIAFGLLAQRATLQRGEEASSWEANEEVRPTPRELLASGGLRAWRRGFVGLAGIALIVLPFTVSSGVINRASLAAIFAMVFVSLVVLTGWAGQVSLGQFGIVAVGALAGGSLTSRANISFWLAIPICAIVCSIVALVIGLPALRIKGLFLAVVTLAFASATSIALFSDKYFGWLQPKNIRRPTFFLLDFEDERSMYYLCLFFLALTILVVVGLRRSRPGRILIALRENETELQSFGVNIVRTKLSAFALSGFICGVAGVLFAHHQRAVGADAFTAQASIDVFVFAVIGGIGSVSGALFGAAVQSVSGFFPQGNIWQFFLNQSVALLAVLYIAPGGLAAIAYAIRDSLLRIVAQRNQIVVPSLFADVDPAVLEQQLIPLASRPERTALTAASTRDEYRMSGSMHHDDGEIESAAGAPDERAVLGEVANRVGSDT